MTTINPENTTTALNNNLLRWFHVDDDVDDLHIYKMMIAETAPTVPWNHSPQASI